MPVSAVAHYPQATLPHPLPSVLETQTLHVQELETQPVAQARPLPALPEAVPWEEEPVPEEGSWIPPEERAPVYPIPVPLPEELPNVPEFPIALLSDVGRDWVEDVCERMQCPIDFGAVASEVVFSSICAGHFVVRPKAQDDWVVTPNLWGAVIGSPGTLKSPLMDEFMKPLRQFEAGARTEFEAAKKAYKWDKTEQEMASKIRKKDLEREKAGPTRIRKALEEIEKDLVVPARKRYIVNDPTVAKLCDILSANSQGVLLFRDELDGWLRNLARPDRPDDQQFFMEAWNGNGCYTQDRVERGEVIVDPLTVSVLGGIPPGPFSTWLRGTLRGGQGDNGFIQRLQLVVWPDNPGAWTLVDRPPNRRAFEAVKDALRRVMESDPLTIGAESVYAGDKPAMAFNSDAGDLFFAYWTELERRLKSDELPPAMQAHLGKFRSLVPSLALIDHLMDTCAGSVTAPSVERAIGWAAYLEAHALRVYAGVNMPELRAARILLSKLLRRELACPFKAREIVRRGWSGMTDKDVVVDALGLLEDHGWVIRQPVPTGERGGRPTAQYILNPKAG